MRLNIDRICELAGLGAASGGLLSEAAVPAPPAAKGPAAPKAAPAPMKGVVKPAPAKPAAAVEGDESYMDEDYHEEGYGMHEEDAEEEGYHMETSMIDDDAMYEIDETELMEALVDMRQRRLEESAVRDAVRDEIKRALSDRSGSWVYGANKPSASKAGQVTRGGFGFGFGFKK